MISNDTSEQKAVPTAIDLRKINKSFGPVQANKDVDLKVAKGSIHGIIGENGAGKSTLMSILYGFYEADSGEILVNGKLTSFLS
jgi:simple sugar transport system ATP-binding protein